MAHKLALIASDLDGTLLLNGAQKLQPETCELIQRLIDKGIIFVAASGRQYANLRRLFEPVKDSIGYICENGCLGYINDEVIAKAVMENDLAHDIIKAIEDTPNCEVLISGKDTCYVRADKKFFAKHIRDVVGNDVTEVDNIFETPETYMKISSYEKGGTKNVGYWKNLFGDRCTVQTGGAEWLDMMPKGVNKSTAFKKLLEYLNVDPQNCIMFGDNDNDCEILSMVGCPITMNTAKSDIRAMGRYNIDTVESALIKILDGDGFDW